MTLGEILLIHLTFSKYNPNNNIQIQNEDAHNLCSNLYSMYDIKKQVSRIN